MIGSIDFILPLIIAYLILFVLLMLSFSINRMKNLIRNTKKNSNIEFLIDTFVEKKITVQQKEKYLKVYNKNLVEDYSELREVYDLPVETKKEISIYFKSNKLYTRQIKNLKSIFKYKRISAAIYLGHTEDNEIGKILKGAFIKEKDYKVKLYIASSLCQINYRAAIYIMTESVIGAPIWYRNKIKVLISEFGNEFLYVIHKYYNREEIEIKEVLFYFGSLYYSEDLKKYLLKNIDILINDKNQGYNEYLLEEALSNVLQFYNEEFEEDKYYLSENKLIRKYLLKSLAKENSRDNVLKLINLFNGTDMDAGISNAINSMITGDKSYLKFLIGKFYEEENIAVKNGICSVMANHIEYLLLKLLSYEKKQISQIIKNIMILNYNSAIIAFMNKNINLELENEIIFILEEALLENKEVFKEYYYYLDSRILNKINYNYEMLNNKQGIKEQNKEVLLYLLLILTVLMFPIVFFIKYFDVLKDKSYIEHLKQYIFDFNYYLIFYTAMINTVYMILLIFSYIGIRKQMRNWKSKKKTFLFKKQIIPKISIIAPAYNEQATIIDSVTSLLNLTYPEYELIVVNDGSKDDTLNILIQNFKLHKVDYLVETKISTKPVFGIYLNKDIPKLIVVDKKNGGKADTLNVGINISSMDYFCGIDADSLLEHGSLLKIASMLTESNDEVIAVGGNVFPINGCEVDNGHINSINLPKTILGRIQMIEYLRAFMVGRIGWAYINSLLIISGAFGVFKKDRVIEVGGYLTKNGIYSKDTVGEDMELVVRLSKYMREKKLKYKIDFCFNANCWTEVPEQYKSLKTQRNRWHRGLIEIMLFHKDMIFNPKFGRIGMITMPYFFIFEMAGPLIEIQGYIMILLAAFLGLLNSQILILLFTVTVFQGIILSMFSLIFSEKELSYFKLKEFVILAFYCIIENLGFRQISSVWRFYAYIDSLKKKNTWGKIERKGFGSN
ncbi:glycosyltransferase family 2 protein [Clostridium grantii]|uniref:Glycosyltransferase, catalytic subunit of cellulose synthase and poly-beta-1,6-N-acetylglucosamine synthase n=1 Tax=Clostridium grantii DSM 8605 TaxID=1121316 RepID=A0A1M5QKA5_9CLOT|nr:glycosyltransferase [Clostridium grantii]SHH14281.1 Glycosyltransferase, catalytic subunit of cellulose synthase and poly-beta-1,6-N-acetylglucosamine synthase [Clostridium grantii DSM 8605]